MPASTNGAPVGAIAAATRSAVGGLTALQSTNTGLLLLAVSAGAKRSASATASPGGRIDRMKSLRAISSSLASVKPYFLARARVSAPRPIREVSTLSPFSTRRPPTAAPIMPGAITATTGFIGRSPIRSDNSLILVRLGFCGRECCRPPRRHTSLWVHHCTAIRLARKGCRSTGGSRGMRGLGQHARCPARRGAPLATPAISALLGAAP